MCLISVVLPAAFSPTSPKTAPRGTLRLTSRERNLATEASRQSLDLDHGFARPGTHGVSPISLWLHRLDRAGRSARQFRSLRCPSAALRPGAHQSARSRSSIARAAPAETPPRSRTFPPCAASRPRRPLRARGTRARRYWGSRPAFQPEPGSAAALHPAPDRPEATRYFTWFTI